MGGGGMGVDPDDDALTWGGSADPTHVDAPVAAAPAEAKPPEAEEPRTSSALLIGLGVFGGVFLLYIVGWIIAVQRTTAPFSNLLAAFMYQLGEILAIASPAVWFFAVLLLTKDRRAVARILWLVLGVVILAPWPFILALGAR